MREAPPPLIAIDHDDYHAKHIGKLPDGRQFFLTTPFIPASGGSAGAEFVALFLFDSDGLLIQSVIEKLGPRAELDDDQGEAVYNQLLNGLGEFEFDRIEVKPFSVEQFGTEFGLIPRPPEDDEDVWAVEMQPGNYMAFFEPWDSGDYDT